MWWLKACIVCFKTDIQIVLLGTGDPGFEQAFSWFSQVFPEKLSANITFDVKLAQEIYAACDIFLMPSRFEPCGLSQMMAMRYGTLPLVNEVGGLRDTVQAFNPIEGTGTGFSFNNLTPYWLNWALQTALDVYHNHPDVWKICKFKRWNVISLGIQPASHILICTTV